MTQTLLNNRYRPIRGLSSGGFGETFLAEDTHMPSGRRCVIKQLKPITNNPQIYQLVQERFQREAAILEELGEGSNQIPKLYAYFSVNGQFYLVQEWIEGETLTNKLRQQGLLSESAVRDILMTLLSVLDYVHSKRMVHRDIKPDNIILRQRDGKPVLIDFGAVKETMNTVVNGQGNNTNSIVIGTPGFMPSEQAAGRPVYSSDLYSLALTAIYLLTGKWPQALDIDPGTGEILWRRYALNISPNLADVLDKAIQFHPRDRYPTARSMLDALQSASSPIPPTVPAQHPPIVSPPPTQKSAQTVPPITSTLDRGSGQKAIIIGSFIVGSFIFLWAAVSPLFTKTPVPEKTLSFPEHSSETSLKDRSLEPRFTNNKTPSPSIYSPPAANPVPPTQSVTINVTPQIASPQTNDFSWLSYREVTDADLAGKSAFELDLMRNSIFARYGRRFKSAELQNYFDNQSWYRPVYSPDEFPNNLLSSLEKQNAVYIMEYQNRNGLRWVR